ALEHPDRLLHPLRRVGELGQGRFERVTWNDALADIAARLGSVIKAYGSKAVAGAVSNQFYDRGVAMALLLRSIGSPNYMINQDLCQGCRSTAALLSGVPGLPGHELKAARCILSVGRSPSDSNIVEWMNIKAAKQAGAKLIVIDPQANGVYTALSFSNLLALTANIDRPGTNRIPKSVPGLRDYHSFIHDPGFRMASEREADIIGAKTYPFWSGPDSWGRACHH